MTTLRREKRNTITVMPGLVGYGQGNGNGESMAKDKTNAFIKNLNDNGVASVATHPQSPKYRGASDTNMNQYFKKSEVTLPAFNPSSWNLPKRAYETTKNIIIPDSRWQKPLRI